MTKKLSLDISGTGRSGIASAFVINNLNLGFDMGVNLKSARGCAKVFVTHGHVDHIGAVVSHASVRSMLGERTTYYMLPHLVEHVEVALDAHRAMADKEHMIAADIVPFAPGDEVEVSKGRVVRSFATDHTTKSQGFLLVDKRQKLREEFLGLPGQEIGRLRKEGADLFDLQEVPLFAYPGDTRASVLDTVPELLTAEVLLMECTYVHDDGRQKADEYGHCHISDFADRAGRFENQRVILTHWSERYSDGEIADAVGMLPEPLRNKVEILR